MDGATSGDRSAGFETVEHTADIGLRVWGPTMEDLFAQAGLGMTALLVNPSKVRALEAKDVTVSPGDLEEVLIAWLQEILYLYEVHRFVVAEIRVAHAGPDGARGEILGESVDRARHEVRMDIKAATYHNLKIERRATGSAGEGFETVVIFDI